MRMSFIHIFLMYLGKKFFFKCQNKGIRTVIITKSNRKALTTNYFRKIGFRNRLVWMIMGTGISRSKYTKKRNKSSDILSVGLSYLVIWLLRCSMMLGNLSFRLIYLPKTHYSELVINHLWKRIGSLSHSLLHVYLNKHQ